MTQTQITTGAADCNILATRMIEMGFSLEASLEALKSANNNLEKACTMLAQQSTDSSGLGVTSSSRSLSAAFSKENKQSLHKMSKR